MNPCLRLYPLAVLFVLGACAKKVEAPQPSARAQLLVDKKWQGRTAVLQETGYPDEDVTAKSMPCTNDDFQRFSLPTACFYDDGPITCGPSVPQAQEGLWELRNDDTQLALTFNPSSASRMVYTIEALTATSLTLASAQTGPHGKAATLHVTFVVIP
jgi:hypothetical protein